MMLITVLQALNCSTDNKRESAASSKTELCAKGARGRRNSVRSLSSALSRTLSSIKLDAESELEAENENGPEQEGTVKAQKPRALKQIRADLLGVEKQIGELEHTIQMKEALVQQLKRHKDTKTTAKEKIDSLFVKLRDDCRVLQEQYQESQSPLLQEKLQETQQRLQDVDSIKELADESSRRALELEGSLRASRKQLEKLRRRRCACEQQLRADARQKTLDLDQEPVKSACASPSPESAEEEQRKESPNAPVSEEALEAYRHEIRNLRRTRELLLEQKCHLDEAKQTSKILNDVDEKRVLQYEEAIEGIDLAIEYKNQLLCGKQLVIDAKGSGASSEEMLLERLLNLSEHEMRLLLHRYFNKIVDLRSSGRKLEVQVVEMECQNEGLACRVQSLSHALQQARLQAERRVLALQQQHEDRLHVAMRRLAGEGGSARVVSRVLERSKQAALALQVAGAGGSKQGDKSNLIARITRYARHEALPRQLQPAAQPPAKVTKEKNKIIIQQRGK